MPVLIFIGLMLALLIFIVWDRRRPAAPLSRTTMSRGYEPSSGAKWVPYLAMATLTGALGFKEWLTPSQPPFTGRGSFIMAIAYEHFGPRGGAVLWCGLAILLLAMAVASFRARIQR